MKNTTKKIIKQLIHSALANKQDAYFCHCCDSKVLKFLDWSNTYQKVICPFCYSHPRHRVLCMYLDLHPEFYNKRLKVLHFAPEEILHQKFSSMANLEYITADLNEPSVDLKIDITDIPYQDNTFDVILCSHVLEHVVDDLTAMKELFRVLKPGGWSFLAVPIDLNIEKTFEDPNIVSPEDRLKYFWQEDHVRLYGLDYKNRLEWVGFKVQVEDCSKLPSQDLSKYGLQKQEIYHLGIKPNNF